MVDFFLSLDKTVQVAIITLCGGVLVAIINGIFSMINNYKKKNTQTNTATSDKITVNQTSNGHHITFIGVQNNGKDEK